MLKILPVNTTAHVWIILTKIESIQQDGHETKIVMDSGDVFTTTTISADDLAKKVIDQLNKIL